MSAVAMDTRPLDRGLDTVNVHPRARGFRVLSRIARSRADEASGYEPRHRREVTAEESADLHASIAS
jgi:hypothetical protein